MPEPTRFTKPRRKAEGDDDLPVPLVLGEIIEPRCHCCVSPHRRAIDKMLALGTSYSEISRVFEGIDRRSIANHDKQHLNYEDAAVRQIIAREVQDAQENLEEGIQGAVMRRVYLKTAMQKALQDLLAGDTAIEVKDALAITQYLDKMETQTSAAQIEEITIQFNAFAAAIKEVCPPEMWPRILDRAKEIAGTAQLPG